MKTKMSLPFLAAAAAAAAAATATATATATAYFEGACRLVW